MNIIIITIYNLLVRWPLWSCSLIDLTIMSSIILLLSRWFRLQKVGSSSFRILHFHFFNSKGIVFLSIIGVIHHECNHVSVFLVHENLIISGVCNHEKQQLVLCTSVNQFMNVRKWVWIFGTRLVKVCVVYSHLSITLRFHH